MTDKERLEEIKRKFDLDRIRKFVDTKLISPQDLIYLIQQAERVQELETTVDFYQSALRDADRRVQELEKENKRLEDFIETIQNVHFVELQREKAENRRYREALELLVKQETLGKDVKTGKTAISYNGMIALKGLGIFNDDEYIVYGVDEVIESVLEEESE